MRDQLKQYVNLLFAGAADCEDIKQEILQNTLDRFDDLVAQGKSVILISSELPEVLGMSDRVLVMKDDAIVAELTGEQINAVEVMRYAL